MGKMMVKHSCNHVVGHNVTGSSEKRESRLSWLEGQMCVECRRRTEFREAERFTKRHNLPVIRERDDNKRKWAEAVRMQVGNALLQSGLEKVVIYGLLSVELRADWWIERRFLDTSSVFSEARGFYDDYANVQDFLTAANLPPLTGNRAQMVWAEVYRMRAAKALMAGGIALEAVAARFSSHVQAWWWLCRKELEPVELFKAAAAG